MRGGGDVGGGGGLAGDAPGVGDDLGVCWEEVESVENWKEIK